MKKAFAVALCLVLVLVLVPNAVTNPNGSSYDPMADANRDKTIDVHDLSRLGRAYGSTQTIPTEPGKAVVYVYQVEEDPPEVENARVAIIDPDFGYPGYQASQVGYTDSFGFVNFTLNPSKNYTAIAWSRTMYSYANFTTDLFGQAGVAIQLGSSRLPPNWVTITLINKSSGELLSQDPGFIAAVGDLVYTHGLPDAFQVSYRSDGIGIFPFIGVVVIGPFADFLRPVNEPGKSYCVALQGPVYNWGHPTFTPDENGNGNMVIYV